MPGDREAAAADTNASNEIADEMVRKLSTNHKFHDILKQVLAEVIDDRMNDEFEKLNGDMFDLNIENQSLKKENKKLQKRVDSLEQISYHDRLALIELQQFNNRNCLMISGIKEKPIEKDSQGKIINPENTDKVVIDLAREKLDLDLKETDFDYSHRMATRMTGKPRPILVKFISFNTRRKVISARKQLKATGIGIHECLAPGRDELFRHAQGFVKEIDKAKACWTWDGNVNVLMDIGNGDEKRFTVGTIDNLKQLAAKYNR